MNLFDRYKSTKTACAPTVGSHLNVTSGFLNTSDNKFMLSSNHILLEHIKQRKKQLPIFCKPSKENQTSNTSIGIRGKSAEVGGGRKGQVSAKTRESIHLQKLEIDSNISKDAIRLFSGHSKKRQAREVVLSHRHD